MKSAANTMEGRNRFAPKTPALIDLSPEEKAQRELYKSLDFFPTPPWATRAMLEIMGDRGWRDVLEPACGRGHMVAPLTQAGLNVYAFDIYDHGIGACLLDFLKADDADFIASDYHHAIPPFDVVITNPPYEHAQAFVRRALELAPEVMVICRLGFLASDGRYDLHRNHLEAVYPFCERVPMHLGRYNPKGKTATETAWFHFKRETDPLSPPAVIHIPPGQRRKHFKPEDTLI